MSADRVCVGALHGAFGVGGEVRLASYTAEPGGIRIYGDLEAEDGGRSFSIESLRPIKGGFAARIAGIGCREDALALKGVKLFIDRDRLPEPEEDEYYWIDLVGSNAFDRNGALVGRVAGVHDFGAGDLLEIAPEAGGDNEFVPFTRQDVPEVRPGRIVLGGWPGRDVPGEHGTHTATPSGSSEG